jgi:hypothetical protein
VPAGPVRPSRIPRESRRHALRSVAGSACEAAGVQAADGLELPLGVVVRKRLQLRFQAAYTKEQQQSGVLEYNFRAMDVRPSPEAGKQNPLAEIAAGLGTDVATYTRETPGMSAFAVEDGVVYHTACCAPAWCAVEPLVHAPEAVQPACIRRVGATISTSWCCASQPRARRKDGRRGCSLVRRAIASSAGDRPSRSRK